VIRDNARSHTAAGSKPVKAYLAAWGAPHQAALPAGVLAAGQPHRAGVVAPARAGHAQRNHRCRSIEELVELTLAWIEDRGPL